MMWLHLLELLSFCEPLDLDTLTGLVGAGAVERAERRGLIRVVAGAAHPGGAVHPSAVWGSDPAPVGGGGGAAAAR